MSQQEPTFKLEVPRSHAIAYLAGLAKFSIEERLNEFGTLQQQIIANEQRLALEGRAALVADVLREHEASLAPKTPVEPAA